MWPTVKVIENRFQKYRCVSIIMNVNIGFVEIVFELITNVDNPHVSIYIFSAQKCTKTLIIDW